jgi:DNA-binding MarR family transcriptional regulator
LEQLREGGFLISKIKQISGRIFDKKLKSHNIDDLNTAQGRIIFSLWKHDNVPISELVRQTALGKTTLSSMLDRLEKSGYIITKQDKNDKRKTLISLSEKSQAIKSRHEAVSKEMIELFYKGLSEVEIDEFEKTLRHILSNLVVYEEKHK